LGYRGKATEKGDAQQYSEDPRQTLLPGAIPNGQAMNRMEVTQRASAPGGCGSNLRSEANGRGENRITGLPNARGLSHRQGQAPPPSQANQSSQLPFGSIRNIIGTA